MISLVRPNTQNPDDHNHVTVHESGVVENHDDEKCKGNLRVTCDSDHVPPVPCGGGTALLSSAGVQLKTNANMAPSKQE